MSTNENGERLFFESFAWTGDISKGFLEERRDAVLETLRLLGIPARAEIVDGDPDAAPEQFGRHQFQPRFADGSRWRLRIYVRASPGLLIGLPRIHHG